MAELQSKSRVHSCEIHRPVVFGPDHADVMLPVGRVRLLWMFREWSNRMGRDDQQQMAEWIGRTFQTMHYGSICSGCDSAWQVLKDMVSWQHQNWSVQTKCKHTWACEKDEQKRVFLKTMHPDVGPIFGDACLLHTGRCKNEVNGEMADVEKIDIATAGFPCQDVSKLNPHSKNASHKSCIEAGSLRTGSVFAGITQFLKQMPPAESPEIVLLENVTNLGRVPQTGAGKAQRASNLEKVGQVMSNELNRTLHTWSLCPVMFGVPAGRQRLWMTAIKRSSYEDIWNEDELHKELNRSMNCLVDFKTNSVDEFLLDDRPGKKSYDIRTRTEWYKKDQQSRTQS